MLGSCIFRGLITVTLDKQYVPVIRNGRTVMYKTAYFGPSRVDVPLKGVPCYLVPVC